MADEPDGTAARILDAAERLVQVRGFNGFSYADVAAQLGVTKASLHYHFQSKTELGEALIARYSRRFAEALAAIDASRGGTPAKLRRYAALYTAVLKQDRMCLCGMMAADYDTLPPAMRSAVLRFFDANERWLAALLEDGRRRGDIGFRGAARETAQLIIGTLEGSMLVARSYHDTDRFQKAASRLLASLQPA